MKRKILKDTLAIVLSLTLATSGTGALYVSAEENATFGEGVLTDSSATGESGDSQNSDLSDNSSNGDLNDAESIVDNSSNDNSQADNTDAAESSDDNSSNDSSEGNSANGENTGDENGDLNPSDENESGNVINPENSSEDISGDADNESHNESSENAEDDATSGDSSETNEDAVTDNGDLDSSSAEISGQEETPAKAEKSELSEPDAANADKKIGEDSTVVFEKTIDGYQIVLTAGAEALPEDTSVEIKKVAKVLDKTTEEIANEALKENEAVFESASFDITFYSEGHEFEPAAGAVNVQITLADEITDKTNKKDDTELQVIHIEDDASATVVEDATVIKDGEETVVTYDADSFSVYDVALVLQFETFEPEVLVNDVYADIVDPADIQYLGEGIDPTQNIKTLMSADKCETVYEMAAVAREAVKARQTSVAINYAIKDRTSPVMIKSQVISAMCAHTGVPNEGDYVRWAYYGNSLAGAASYANNCTYGTLIINFSYTQNADQEVATTNAINNLLNNEFASVRNGSDYQKANAVYEYIYRHIFYDYSANSKATYGDYLPYSCYSAVVQKKTVCEGYALLFYRLMLSMGVDSRLIPGNGNGENHGWNIVKIGKLYYNLDATWDSNIYESFFGRTNPGGNYTPAYKFVGNSQSISYSYKDSNGNINTHPTTTFDTEHVRWSGYYGTEFDRIYPRSETHYVSGGTYTTESVVSLNTTSATLTIGQTLQLIASLSSSNQGSGVKFESTDSSVATVTATGLVCGMDDGECDIIASSWYGLNKAVCHIKVTDSKPYNVEVASTNITIRVGETYGINPVVYPTWAANKTCSYTSSDKKIAKVNSNGVITGKKVGKCSITVRTVEGGSTVKITVNVKKQKHVKSVKLPKKITLKVGQKVQLNAKIKPSDATVKTVTWKSSKKKVASVNKKGVVTAKKKGTAIITVKTKDGKKTAKCKIIVK